MAAVPADPRVGTTLAGYRVVERLGRGGMGIVYRAEHLRLGRPAALKIVAPELAGDRAFRERFAREARIAATLEHPHVVTVYDAGEADGVLYLAMRLVEGGDLAAELLTRGALEPARAIEICGQVAGALDEAHARGLIHRDVKPANVLLDGRGSYLTDFGLAHGTPTGGISRPGDLVGTIHYVAPEQIQGADLSGAADQYALAAMLFHCLCGGPPFGRSSDVAVMYAHMHDDPPAASAARAGLPPALDAVLARGMEKVPARRFPTCAALVKAARQVLEAAGPLDLAPPRVVPPEGDDSKVTTQTDLPAQPAASADRRTRVLLVGVDPQTRALARVALAGRCDVREVEGGDAVVDAAREQRPDLVLLDWAAPGPGARATVAALRADPMTREVKIVLAVDWESGGSEDVRAAGADDLVETPFSPLQLQVKLRRLLGAGAVLG